VTTRPTLDAAEHWMDRLPEREVYDMYARTLASRFPAFAVRDFDEARFDTAQTLHRYDDGGRIDQALVDVIVTPESHDRFTEDLEAFAVKHGLRGWLDAGESMVVVTDHGQFTDVPVVAETMGRVGLGDRATTVQIVSEMISQMALDVGAGEFAVIAKLRCISAVVQTVPRLDGSPSADARRYRDRKNGTALRILEAVRDTPGSKTVASLVARHNARSKNGTTLYIHEPNRRTLETYEDSGLKIVPVAIHCPTFGDDGSIAPADMQYEFFPPLLVTDARRDTRAIVEMFRAATNRFVGDEYEHGVKVRSWRAQMAAQRVKDALPAGRRGPAEIDDD
jgi:hypothetical protein